MQQKLSRTNTRICIEIIALLEQIHREGYPYEDDLIKIDTNVLEFCRRFVSQYIYYSLNEVPKISFSDNQVNFIWRNLKDGRTLIFSFDGEYAFACVSPAKTEEDYFQDSKYIGEFNPISSEMKGFLMKHGFDYIPF